MVHANSTTRTATTPHSLMVEVASYSNVASSTIKVPMSHTVPSQCPWWFNVAGRCDECSLEVRPFFW